jgi:hypothetical protein
LSFALLAVQKANSALGQDCADDGHGAALGGRSWLWGVFWGGHPHSYGLSGKFFSRELGGKLKLQLNVRAQGNEMGFHYRDLEKFDPMKGDMSWAPFRAAKDIAWRARNLLYGRNNAQVKSLASELDSWIDAYFDSENENSIQMLKDEKRYDLLDSDEDGNNWEVKSEAHDEFDIRNSDNTEPLEAAKEVFESMDILHAPDLPDAKDYEYFAAMALSMIGTYLDALENTFDIKKMKSVKRLTKNYEPHEVSRFGSQLIEAMEVVTYAESLKRIARIEKTMRTSLEKAHKKDVLIVEEQVKAQLTVMHNENKEKQKKWGQLGKDESLKERNKSRAAVLAQWDADVSLQKKSIAKAAAALWAWLVDQRYKQSLQEFSPETIEKWISAHKKTLSS